MPKFKQMTLFFVFLRFAHLISIDFFDDLFGVLNELVITDVSKAKIRLCDQKWRVAFKNDVILFDLLGAYWLLGMLNQFTQLIMIVRQLLP